MSQQPPGPLGIFASSMQIDLTTSDALQQAVLYDRPDIVLTLIDRGTNIDRIASQDWTALQVACCYGRFFIAKTLLSCGASTEIARRGRTALHMAVDHGHADVLLLLIDNGADVNAKLPSGASALHLATMSGRSNVLRILIDQVADLEEKAYDKEYSALHLACEYGRSQCVVELLSAGADPNTRLIYDQTPLMTVVMTDHVDIAITLLDSGAEVDAEADEGLTAAQLAAFCGNTRILQILISRGTDVLQTNQHGDDVLHSAIRGRQSQTTLLLLQQSGLVQRHYGDHRVTALHSAVSGNLYEVVRALLNKGADTEACDADGDTALQYAVEADRMRMVKLLLHHGAQINKCNNITGETVLHWAVKGGLTSMTQALLAHGGNPSLVDLISLQKSKLDHKSREVDDGNFESCKAMLRSALDTLVEVRLAKQFDWPLAQDSNSGDNDPDDDSDADLPEQIIQRRITNPIRELKDQAAARLFITSFQDEVVHESIKCSGLRCASQTESLRGIRYKCTWCDDIDLCSTCVSSNVSGHKDHHLIIKCYLPTKFYSVSDVNDNMKRMLVLTDPESAGSVQEVSHIMLGITEQRALRQLQASLSNVLDLDWSQAASLLEKPTRSYFPIYRTKGLDNEASIESPTPCKDGIEDGISLSFQSTKSKNLDAEPSSSNKRTMVPGLERVLHYQEEAHILRVWLGDIKQYNYQEDETLKTRAQQGQAVTRLVDLKPGTFGEKIEIELRVVDIMQQPTYDALTYTWKETVYERSLVDGFSKEENLRMRQNGNVGHAVYLHNAAGDEAFWAINTGLRDAILRLRDPHQTKTIWIDQLCIDQQNLGERSFQVKRMGNFYNRARKVIVWAGEEDEYTRATFKLYEKIAGAYQCREKDSRPKEGMPFVDMSDIDPPTLKMLLDFFKRPVFRRSWCIQEIVLGKMVTVQCGDCEIEWAHLASAASVLGHINWERYPGAQDHEGSTSGNASTESVEMRAKRLYGNILQISGIHELRRMFQMGKKITLEKLLWTSDHFETSEVKDKIYSLIGICHHKSKLDGLDADYAISDTEAFTKATRFCIKQSESMHVCGMTSSTSAKNIVGLPSWVPDYTNANLDHAFPFSRPSPPIPYNACGGVALSAAWPYEQHQNVIVISTCHVGTVIKSSYHMSINQELPRAMVEWSTLVDAVINHPTGESIPDVFALTCFADSAGIYRDRPHSDTRGFLETVKAIITWSFVQYMRENPAGKGRKHMNTALGRTAKQIMTEHCAKFATNLNIQIEAQPSDLKEPQPDDLPADEPLRRNCVESSSQPEVMAHEIDESTTSAEPSSNESNDKGRAAFSSIPTSNRIVFDEEPPQSKVNPELENVARHCVILACRDRRLFITSDNYFGLGPRDIQKGDEVHILSGTKVPFVLRRVTADTVSAKSIDPALISTVTNDGLALYQMIGECFVHGFMQGEVTRRDDLTWDNVAIC